MWNLRKKLGVERLRGGGIEKKEIFIKDWFLMKD